MKKREFLDNLKGLISVLPSEDVNKYLEYYQEMIDDRIDDGISEEEAVKAVGNPKIIAEQILKDNGISTHFTTDNEESQTDSGKNATSSNAFNSQFTSGTTTQSTSGDKKKLDELSIILIIATFPIWVPLLAGAFSLIVGIVAVIFSLIISIWACALAFIVSGVFGGIIGGIVSLIVYDVGVGISLLGAGILLVGLSILFYLGALYLTKLSIYLSKKLIEFIKNKIKKGA